MGAATTALDATASRVYGVTSTVDAGLNAKSELIVAATQGLLRLASRVPLVGQIAGALQDLFTVYQVRSTAKSPTDEGPASTGVESNRVYTCTRLAKCAPLVFFPCVAFIAFPSGTHT